MTRDLVRIGKALSAPARVAMINVLFDGTEHAAGELAAAAAVSAATASEHLLTLADAGIVTGRSDGRYRYYQLANADIAHALEQLSDSYPAPAVTSLRLSREQQRVRVARTCYDHLAGQLGVALADRFVELGWVDQAMFLVTSRGARQLRDRLDVQAVAAPGSRRPVLRPCADWTERRPHLAGSVGVAIATAFLHRRWVARKPGSRGLLITPQGRLGLAELGIVTSIPAG